MMQQFEKESTKMEMSGEMMDDVLDDVLGEDQFNFRSLELRQIQYDLHTFEQLF